MQDMLLVMLLVMDTLGMPQLMLVLWLCWAWLCRICSWLCCWLWILWVCPSLCWCYGYAGLGYAGYAPGYAAGYGYAGYAPAYAGAYGYSCPLPPNTQLIAHPNGAVVPLDEPAVAAARADHLATKGVAYAAAAPVVAAVPAVAAAPVAAVGYGYAGPLNLNTQLVA